MLSSTFVLGGCVLLLASAFAGQAQCEAFDSSHGCDPAAADEVSMLQQVNTARWEGGGRQHAQPGVHTPIWDSSAPGCGGPSGSHNEYPNLEGAMYNWTSYQSTWNPPADTILQAVNLQPVFTAVTTETASGAVKTGPFLYMQFTDPFLNGTGPHRCVFDTEASVMCVTPSGRPVGRFLFAGGQTPGCTPRGMAMMAGPLVNAGGAVGVWTGPLVLAGAKEQVVGGEAASHAPAPAGSHEWPSHRSGPGCGAAGRFPKLAGHNYTVRSELLSTPAMGIFQAFDPVDGTSPPKLAILSADSWNFSFFDNMTVADGISNERNQFVQLNINDGERWALCAFDDTLEPDAAADFFLSCTVRPESRFLFRLAIMRDDVHRVTCVPRRLSLARAGGSLPHPAGHRGEPVREVAVMAADLHLDGIGQEGGIHGEIAAHGGAARSPDYPSLAGHKYKWLSYQLTGTTDQPGNVSSAAWREATAHFFNQVGKGGRFVQVHVWDNGTYPYEAICQFEDLRTLSCTDRAEGLLSHRFQVVEGTLNTGTGVPGRLTELRYGSLALRGSKARQVMLAVGRPSLKH